jgi:hypothetical protein
VPFRFAFGLSERKSGRRRSALVPPAGSPSSALEMERADNWEARRSFSGEEWHREGEIGGRGIGDSEIWGKPGGGCSIYSSSFTGARLLPPRLVLMRRPPAGAPSSFPRPRPSPAIREHVGGGSRVGGWREDGQEASSWWERRTAGARGPRAEGAGRGKERGGGVPRGKRDR